MDVLLVIAFALFISWDQAQSEKRIMAAIKAVEKRIDDLEQEQVDFEEEAGSLLGLPCSDWMRDHT